MTSQDLLNKLLCLVPQAQCSISDIDNRANVDDGHSTIVELSGYLVVWNSSNTTNCPTQEQLDALEFKIKLLMQQGLNINAQNKVGNTVAHDLIKLYI